MAPAGVPAPILARLLAEFDAALASDALAVAMAAISTDMRRLSPAQADAMLLRERRLWTDAMRARGATAE